MVYKVLETNYRGFHMVLDESGDKPFWKCFIGEHEYKFPTKQDANATVDEIVEGSKAIVREHGGKRIRSVSKFGEVKQVPIELPY